MGLLVDQTSLRKIPLRLRLSQQKLPKLKIKEKTVRKAEQNTQELGDNSTRFNVYTIGVLEGNGEKGAKGIFEIIAAENFLNLKTGTYQQIQEAFREKKHDKYIYIKKLTPNHDIFKLHKIKDKDKILEEAREGK